MQAFSDSSISGIISTIGGDDSIRLIPHIDLQVIANNPKIFLGYSDSTVTHFACLKAGVSSFYGPSIMSGFAENCGIHNYLKESVEQNLFRTDPPGVIHPNEQGWTVEHLDWAMPENNRTLRSLSPCTGWRYLQGTGVSQGRLIGGCLEVLEWLRDTSLWPTAEQWRGAILFIETSEEGPSPTVVTNAMRSYAAEGVLQSLNGILFGRPGGHKINPERFFEYDDAIQQVVRDEQGLDQLPIVTNMDFGHTDPMMTLPYGALTQIDCLNQQVQILESSVVP
jgi:muramoyltetrapeptide carboxypeptidase LdcA involved in peptidoglycan recycling